MGSAVIVSTLPGIAGFWDAKSKRAARRDSSLVFAAGMCHYQDMFQEFEAGPMKFPSVILLILIFNGRAIADDRTQLAAQVKQIFRTRCYECHGQSRTEAGINVMDRDSYVAADGQIIPGDIDGSYLFDTIVSDDENVRMPRSPLPALRPDEIRIVRKWIAEGATAFPDDVETSSVPDTSVIGNEYVLKSILSFVRDLPVDRRPFYRFFSSNHLLAAGATKQELKTQQQALAKAVNHLTWAKDIVVPVPVDEPIGSVFAVDVSKAGWMATPYHTVVEGRASQQSTFNLYDQVLLEYPYSVAMQSSETWNQVDAAYLRNARLVRPIPYVRTDWFSSVATQFPVYEDMLQLPQTLSELEIELGVHFAVNAEARLVHRAGMTVSGVSRNNRVIERHPAKYGAYWKSFDFESSRGLQNMFIDPLNFHFAGGEMIWNLPNGMQAYLITDSDGNRINAAPTSIVTDKFAEDKVVRNGLACMRCHDRGMKRFADNIRPAFEALPDSSRANRSEVLSLYIEQELMNQKVKSDETRFLDAMQIALGEPQRREPLIPVSRRFLDAPITLSQAAGELGLSDTRVLKEMFKLPEFTQLGLAGLTSGGVVRRDTWEDYYDRVVSRLGAGIPIIPIDGLIRVDHIPDGFAAGLTIKTNRFGNTFAVGDELVVTVANNTGRDQYIELLGTDSKAAKSVLSTVQLVKNGQSYRFPRTGTIRIQPQLGKEFITVFASPQPFNPGVLLRGYRVADRFVHDFYRYTDDRWHNLPTGLTKKTVTIETR